MVDRPHFTLIGGEKMRYGRVIPNIAYFDVYAARGAFHEALECGGDRATALGGWWNRDDSQRVMLAPFSRCQPSPALPKRWLDRHRTPKCFARNEHQISSQT